MLRVLSNIDEVTVRTREVDRITFVVNLIVSECFVRTQLVNPLFDARHVSNNGALTANPDFAADGNVLEAD